MFDIASAKIAVIGLGYVGLPVAVEFGKQREVVGYDIDRNRIQSLQAGHDKTNEITAEEISSATNLSFTHNIADLNTANVYIVTVPTPIDQSRQPDLTALIHASRTIGEVLSVGDVVIYESTVYPGATEEECVPVLEEVSGLALNQDFYVGYSPERINPGDKQHTIASIKKVTSGSTPAAANFIDQLYQTIVTVGTHLAPSIKVAEAAKVIENTQRDLNIALINELSIIFNKLGIDTLDVLEAAGTKWNFLPFRPGLVGGHCIGVDPYYLTHKAQTIGYHPEMILAGRRINDSMANYVVSELVKQLFKKQLHSGNTKVLVMGLSFKENCPDMRNSKVIDIVNELEGYGLSTDVYDPCVDKEEAHTVYGIELIARPEKNNYEAIIISVAHDQFKEWGPTKIQELLKEDGILYDLKYILPAQCADLRL